MGLPDEQEIEIMIHAPHKEEIDLYTAKRIAHALSERINKGEKR
jgi:hypothetical protein